MPATSERDEQDGGQRGRPGRRSLQDRRGAVLALLQVNSTIDQSERRLGVRSETVEGWRDTALAAAESARLRGDVPNARVRALEQENDTLWDTLRG